MRGREREEEEEEGMGERGRETAEERDEERMGERGRETTEERGGRENNSLSSLFFLIFSLSFNILFSLKRNSFLRILISENCQKDSKKIQKNVEK